MYPSLGCDVPHAQGRKRRIVVEGGGFSLRHPGDNLDRLYGMRTVRAATKQADGIRVDALPTEDSVNDHAKQPNHAFAVLLVFALAGCSSWAGTPLTGRPAADV